MWVLMVIVWTQAVPNVAFHDFGSEAACEQAAKTFQDPNAGKWTIHATPAFSASAVCTPKGS